MGAWVDVEVPVACVQCGRHVHEGLRWWDPNAGGLHCKACAARLGMAHPPAAARPPSRSASAVHARNELPLWHVEDVRRLRLKRDDTCRQCGGATPAGTWAGWDEAQRVVVCEACLESGTERHAGVPGASAAREAERRREEWRREAEIIWGDEAANDTYEDPRSLAFKKGAEGERRLGPMLESLVAGKGWVLHDRAASRNSNIDHIAVVPSGVWVIDSKNHRGKVRVRRRGLFGPVQGMRVRGRDRTDLVHGSKWQIDVVSSAVDDPTVPVHLMLALPDDAAFGWFSKSFQLDGVWRAPPGRLNRHILGAPPHLRTDEVERLAARLAARLPPAAL